MSPPRKRQRTTFATIGRTSDEESSYDGEPHAESDQEAEDTNITQEPVQEKVFRHVMILK